MSKTQNSLNGHAEQAAEDFMHFMNGATQSQMETFAQVVTGDHRTIQQSAFAAMMKCVEIWSNNWLSNNHDGRNEMTCRASSIIAYALDIDMCERAPLFKSASGGCGPVELLGLPYV